MSGGKRQLRKSISLKAARYEELGALAELSGLSRAATLEAWIASSARTLGVSVDDDEADERAREHARSRAEKRARQVEESEALRMEAFG